ncbi:15112_t:CDS:1, partial [Gigaspora rosea]
QVELSFLWDSDDECGSEPFLIKQYNARNSVKVQVSIARYAALYLDSIDLIVERG